MQITKAMELVASSKLRRAKERAEETRPYFTTLHECLTDIAYGNTDFSSPFVQQREVKKTCYIMIAGDRGLAGGYNTNLFKTVAEHMEYCAHRGLETVTDAYATAEDVSLGDCFPSHGCSAGSSARARLTRCMWDTPILCPCSASSRRC